MSILVSYVPTPEGWAALDLAIQEASLRRTSVVVLNLAVGSDFADATFADDVDLDAVRARLTELGLAYDVQQISDCGDIADAVVRVAAEHDCELVVVGLRRRSPVGKALLGSNAQHIILSAHCPVLSVRPSPA
jgi:nucleotide-binding universal stress UspA family protein